MPRSAGPGGLGKCYLGAARFSYVKSYLRGEGDGGGDGNILPDATRAPRGSPVKGAPRTPSGMYGAEMAKGS